MTIPTNGFTEMSNDEMFDVDGGLNWRNTFHQGGGELISCGVTGAIGGAVAGGIMGGTAGALTGGITAGIAGEVGGFCHGFWTGLWS